MGILDLYSKRMKRSRGEISDVYVYDQLSSALRVQIVHILRDSLGTNTRDYFPKVSEAYEAIVEALCREYGKFTLAGQNGFLSRSRDYESELLNFILQEPDVEMVLDAIELGFRVVDVGTRDFGYRQCT